MEKKIFWAKNINDVEVLINRDESDDSDVYRRRVSSASWMNEGLFMFQHSLKPLLPSWAYSDYCGRDARSSIVADEVL